MLAPGPRHPPSALTAEATPTTATIAPAASSRVVEVFIMRLLRFRIEQPHLRTDKSQEFVETGRLCIDL
jgi:hypothetical protein